MRDFGNRRSGGGGGFRRSFGPREMHKAVCSSCGKECEVPFKPTEGRPVYCKDCYMSQKGEFRGDRPRREQAPKQDDDVKEQFEEETEETSAEESEESEDFSDEPKED